ncbi:site-specific recombinase XerD [Pseudomonas sp. GM80]|nr:site-specific recombinase XerD [Pseudomonas sp. GM80]
MMRKWAKLHSNLPKGTRIATGVYIDATLLVKDASGLPCMHFPDGTLCYEANAYFVHGLMSKALSMRNKGGSASQYAFALSELVRYVFYNRISFLEITNTRFEQFILSLGVARNEKGSIRRNNETIRAIGSRALDFLAFVGEHFGYEMLVGKNGIIKGFRIEPGDHEIIRNRGFGISWYHPCFPDPSSATHKARYPVSDDDIKALKSILPKFTRSLSRRYSTLLSVLEHTGARIDEASCMLVPDIVEAYRKGDTEVSIRVGTLKRGDNHTRLVPVPKVIVSQWIDYIDTTRRNIVTGNLGVGFDHGFLFINQYTGAPISVDTLKNDINDIKTKAGITGQAHAHLFRHRFITEKLKMLIMRYDYENQDAFKRALIDPMTLKQQVQQWTGHKLLESLDPYIHLAFKEIAQMGKSVKSALFFESVSAAYKYMEDARLEMERGGIGEDEYRVRVKAACINMFSLKPGTLD